LKDLLVMKFGGTSMAGAERIRTAARLAVRQKKKRPVLVVVSAMSGITDLLIDTLKFAEAGETSRMEANFRELEARHVAACRELLPPEERTPVMEEISNTVAGFERIARGMLMLGERPPRSVDEAIAFGEHLSSTLMAAHLRSQAVAAEAVNSKEIVVTDAVFGSASPLLPPTRERVLAMLLPLLERGTMPIVTGFNGATVDGQPTTLGRGGSDFTASLLAWCLDAAEVWIWTDVDGIMTADPRLVPDSAVLREVTYREAAELAYNGAKVLHPRTLAPLIDKKIPAWSKNSFAPEKPGTKIAEARALEALSAANAEVLSFSSSSYRQSFCFLVRQEELEAAKKSLEAGLTLELAHGYLKPIEVDEDVGLLAVVGEGMQGTPGIAGRIFTAISRQKINIKSIAQGSSELTISIVVRRDGLEKAVRAIHADCKMAEKANKPATVCLI